VTGHSYIVYGPLANASTTFMFESTPLFPDASRYWASVERHRISIFYTAPTAIRALMKFGEAPVAKHDLSTLRVLGSVGEPINPEAWRWYHRVVGGARCPIVDTFWQTETGGHMLTPLPFATPTKPGAATLPFFGVEPLLLDAQSGAVLTETKASGVLVFARAWPGMARTIYRDHQRFLTTYLTPYAGYYFTGDGADRDADGYYWITGRVDDVMNVSGHRIGSAEVESALVLHPSIAEAAVIGIPHDIKGTAMFAYVTPKQGVTVSPQLISELRAQVRKEIGAFAVPDELLVTAALPKTRSGKIMRRILRKIAACETDTLGDVSTLAEPAVVDDLIRGVQAMRAPPAK
jgi:acetyl-CoA synthetase